MAGLKLPPPLSSADALFSIRKTRRAFTQSSVQTAQGPQAIVGKNKLYFTQYHTIMLPQCIFHEVSTFGHLSQVTNSWRPGITRRSHNFYLQKRGESMTAVTTFTSNNLEICYKRKIRLRVLGIEFVKDGYISPSVKEK